MSTPEISQKHTKNTEIVCKDFSYVFDNYNRPTNYIHLSNVQKLLHKIKHQKLNLNNKGARNLYLSQETAKKVNRFISRPQYIDYNLFGTVTGRLTTFEKRGTLAGAPVN